MAQAAAALSPGATVLGRYRPLRPLGSGGAGSVWLARDEVDERDVALKIVPREGTMGPRAEREAAASARLRHSRCLRAYALARDSEHVYIAYEYVHGCTLRHAMREGRLDDRDLVEAAVQILDGLAHAHGHGIVHRDIKPANVLLREGDEVAVKIMDFGLALMSEEETLTAAGDIPGTLAYISPERLRGETAGPAADVWSVGVLLWEGLAGHHPFWNGTLVDTARSIQEGAASLATQRPDLPAHLIELVDSALAVNPRRRPSAAKLAAALRSAGEQRRRRARGPRPPLASPRLALVHLAPTVAAVLFATWTATALPFYPAGWWAALAILAGAFTLAAPRAGLALALAVPVLPLGNYSLGLSLLYAAGAAAWLAVWWREPRAGLFLVLGPLLGPVAGLGLLPLAGQVVQTPWRRAVAVGGAGLAAAAVSHVGRIGGLDLASTRGPLPAGHAVWQALAHEASPGLLAVGLACCALLLPHARGRGLWGGAVAGAAMLVLTVLPAPGEPALPLVLGAWLTAGLLVCEPFLRSAAAGERRPATPRRRPTGAGQPV